MIPGKGKRVVVAFPDWIRNEPNRERKTVMMSRYFCLQMFGESEVDGLSLYEYFAGDSEGWTEEDTRYVIGKFVENGIIHMERPEQNKEERRMDYSGELVLTYDVSVYDPETKKTIVQIGPGYSAVARFAEIAEAGIPEAEEIEELWGNNYLVTFRGDGLIAFLKKHYRQYADRIPLIDPERKYVLDCYDMS